MNANNLIRNINEVLMMYKIIWKQETSKTKRVLDVLLYHSTVVKWVGLTVHWSGFKSWMMTFAGYWCLCNPLRDWEWVDNTFQAFLHASQWARACHALLNFFHIIFKRSHMSFMDHSLYKSYKWSTLYSTFYVLHLLVPLSSFC